MEISRGLLDRKISNSGSESVKSCRTGNPQHRPLEINGVHPNSVIQRTDFLQGGQRKGSRLGSQTVCLQQWVGPSEDKLREKYPRCLGGKKTFLLVQR